MMKFHTKGKMIVYWILVVLIAFVEISDALMMLGYSNYGAVVVHFLLGVCIVIAAWESHRLISNQYADASQGRDAPVAANGSMNLMIANLVLLLTIAVHDTDHMRQAMGWGYKFTIPLLLVNIVVYIPGTLGLISSAKSLLLGGYVTTVVGPLIALSFLKLHLLGAFIKVWGPWNISFFALHVDALSWWILAATAIVGAFVGFAGIYQIGKIHGSRLQTKLA